MPQVKSRRLFFPPMHTHTWVQISIKGEIWLCVCVSCVFAGARERGSIFIVRFSFSGGGGGWRVRECQ